MAELPWRAELRRVDLRGGVRPGAPGRVEACMRCGGCNCIHGRARQPAHLGSHERRHAGKVHAFTNLARLAPWRQCFWYARIYRMLLQNTPSIDLQFGTREYI